MYKIAEAIVVEGRYDKNTLSQIVDAAIIETSGFGVFNDREKQKLIRRLAEKRGLIVFTDSDGAGFVIRSFIKSRRSISSTPTSRISKVRRNARARPRRRESWEWRA